MMKGEKKERKRKRDAIILWSAVALTVAIIAAAIVLCIVQPNRDSDAPVQTVPTQTPAPLSFEIPGFTPIEEVELPPSEGQLKVVAVGRFTGAYVEDGSDEEVTDVLALIVENAGQSWVGYAELMMDCGGETARFTLSSLPGGASAFLMEKNRMTYVPGTACRLSEKVKLAEQTSNVMDFSDDFALYPDDGVINVQNISGRDHAEDVAVYYKNYRYGLYFGGICYRARFENGIRDGELVQSVQPHYSNADSVILFMSYEQ